MPGRAVTSLSRELGLPGHGPAGEASLADAKQASSQMAPSDGARWHRPPESAGLCMEEIRNGFAQIFAERLGLEGRVTHVSEAELYDRIRAAGAAGA